MTIGEFAKLPHQFFMTFTAPDRIAECDPAAATDPVHQKGIMCFAE